MDEKIISSNLKKLRQQKKLTLEALANKTGLTKGYLSKLERSQKAPPYSTLTKLAGALGTEVTTILSHNIEPLKDTGLSLGRNRKRRLIRETDQFAGYDYEVMAENKPGKNMEPFIIHSPFEIRRTYAHEGEEFIYVLEGQLEFHYGDQIYTLNQGDDIYFDSIVPHAGKSLGNQKAKLLVVIYFYKRNRQ